MSDASTHEVTNLLHAWRAGDQAALDPLLAGTYHELRRIAHGFMLGERRDHSLQPSELVNEAFLRIAGLREIEWHDRVHFFALTAHLMRRVLVDHARSRNYEKRGGGAKRVEFDETAIAPDAQLNVVALDDALTALAQHDARKAKVVELRYFVGFSVDETAAALEVSPQTVLRDWSLAKAWLTREMLRQH